MHQRVIGDPEAPELDLWSLFEPVDIRRYFRRAHFQGFLMLVRSPGTHAFSVQSWDLEAGKVDLLVRGRCENLSGEEETAKVPYTVWAAKLSPGEKAELMKTVRATYSTSHAWVSKVRRNVAEALGTGVPG